MVLLKIMTKVLLMFVTFDLVEKNISFTLSLNTDNLCSGK